MSSRCKGKAEDSKKSEVPGKEETQDNKNHAVGIGKEDLEKSEQEDEWQELYGGLIEENEDVSIDNKETYDSYFKDLPEYSDSDNSWMKEKREAFRRKLVEIYQLSEVYASDLKRFFQSNEYREMCRDYRCVNMIYYLCRDKKWGMRANKVAIHYIRELEESNTDVEIVNLCKKIQRALSHNGLDNYTMRSISVLKRGSKEEKRAVRIGIIIASITMILLVIGNIYFENERASTLSKTNHNSEIPDVDSMMEYQQEYIESYHNEREKTPSECMDDSVKIADGIFMYNKIGVSMYVSEEDVQCEWDILDLGEQFEGKNYRTLTCKMLKQTVYSPQIWMIDTVYLSDLGGESYSCYLYQEGECTMIPIKSEPASIGEMLDGAYGVIEDGKICLPMNPPGTGEMTFVFLAGD